MTASSIKEVVAVVRERLDLETIFRMVAAFTQGLIKAETVLIPVLDENCSTYPGTYRISQPGLRNSSLLFS